MKHTKVSLRVCSSFTLKKISKVTTFPMMVNSVLLLKHFFSKLMTKKIVITDLRLLPEAGEIINS